MNSYWIIALCLFVTTASAQSSCEYTLRLFDSFGDSWNGATLRLQVNESFSVYTMNVEDGIEKDVPLIFTTGDVVTMEFLSGEFDNEITYELYDPNEVLLFEDGPSPTVDNIFSDTIVCPSCGPVPFAAMVIEDIRDFTTTLSWLQSNDNNTYWVQYGTAGFSPDSIAQYSGVTTNTNSVTLMGLSEKQSYEVYISSLCGSDTSRVVGPLAFETVYTYDVGVVDIVQPTTGCDIGEQDTLEITLRNFGAKPLSLIPFNFINNEIPGSVSQPIDGLFTGVLGKDSTFTIPFDKRLDIGEYAIYEILAYTELENDSNMSNDTFKVEIINIPNVVEYPYFTDFEDWTGGWRAAEYSNNSSWEFGTPNFEVLLAASGDNAWMTALDTSYNNNELSYLLSPCLDFSMLEEDPIISFSLFIDTESCCDEVWTEVSTDGGDTWRKIRSGARSFNWYNDPGNEWWDGDGGFSTWTTVSTLLTGVAGEAEAAVRVVFSSDFSSSAAGVGIDNVFISEPLENDIAALNVNHTSQEECGEVGDQVILEIVNLGEGEQRGFDVFYQINGGEVVSERINEPLASLESLTYTFTQDFNSSVYQQYTILAWTQGSDDEFAFNDTTQITIANLRSIPFAETFEQGILPEGWETPGEGNAVTLGHSAPSFVLSDNFFQSDTYFEANTPVFGYVAEGDSLRFDYRFVDFGTPGDNLARTLAEGDSLVLRVSVDCGENYTNLYKIDSSNHMPTEAMRTIKISLIDFIDQSIKLRFATYSGGGDADFYIDLDNINVKRCGPNLDLSARVDNLLRSDVGDGSIIIEANAGLPPYTYQWSNDESTKGIFGLEVGTYSVTVTDAVGCSDELTVDVTVTDIKDVEVLQAVRLAPNPSSGNTDLNIELHEQAEVKVILFNAMGQLVRDFPIQKAQQLHYRLDLNEFANGLYFVQIWANGQAHTERLILLRE